MTETVSDPRYDGRREITDEVNCQNCGRVVMRRFINWRREITVIGPPRTIWTTKNDEALATSRPSDVETVDEIWCSECAQSEVPAENRAHDTEPMGESDAFSVRDSGWRSPEPLTHMGEK